jgi:hypothetical protein
VASQPTKSATAAVASNCGAIADVDLHCTHCDKPMHATDVDVLPGPGEAVTCRSRPRISVSRCCQAVIARAANDLLELQRIRNAGYDEAGDVLDRLLD